MCIYIILEFHGVGANRRVREREKRKVMEMDTDIGLKGRERFRDRWRGQKGQKDG
jgi:hypothetical protein